MPYREEPHAPLLHRLWTPRYGGGTVPVLVHGAHRLVSSTDILGYADTVCGGGRLYPPEAALSREVKALEAHFDAELGPHTRRWAYAQLLPETGLLRQVWAQRVPRLEAGLVPAIVPIARKLVRAAYGVTPDGAARSLERVHAIFAEVSACLDERRGFLVGDRFTAADLTFAALAAPVVFPAGCRAVLPALEAVPGGMRDEVLRLRDTPAGEFALRLYACSRDHSSAVV